MVEWESDNGYSYYRGEYLRDKETLGRSMIMLGRCFMYMLLHIQLMSNAVKLLSVKSMLIKYLCDAAMIWRVVGLNKVSQIINPSGIITRQELLNHQFDCAIESLRDFDWPLSADEVPTCKIDLSPLPEPQDFNQILNVSAHYHQSKCYRWNAVEITCDNWH